MSRAQRSTPAPTVRVFLLGPFQIEQGDNLVVLPRRKLEPLLAYLILYPQPHSREKLAALFWGEFTDDAARASLRTHLAALKKQFGEGLLLAERETIQLNPAFPLWVDTSEFEKARDSRVGTEHSIPTLQSLIALYRGALLADFYDDWIVPQRERFQTLYFDARLRVIELQRAQSEYVAAIESARRLLGLDPANERAHQHLMFLYVVTGNRQAALEQYEKCVRALDTELAAPPASETKALARWIKQTPGEAPSLAARLTNLPIPITSFIGRKRQVAQVKQLLASSSLRLVSLIGAGGSGKTRLAIQVGTETLAVYPDGVWWTELAALTDPAQVPAAIAQALAIAEVPPRPLSETLVAHLQPRAALLILDNCEHLVDTCARLADELLAACPHLTILATSREPIGIGGEQVWRVPTLSVPTRDALALAARVLEYEAVRLFVERARAARADFVLTDENALAVTEVCQRLDGIPLAIELAAARVTLLTPAQIAARLDDRFNLLTSGNRTALPRQQTLRALIDWSYELLPRPEQTLFQRLAVFEAGGTLEAIETVCSDTQLPRPQILGALAALANKSLIVVHTIGVAARYRMLETLREYAYEKLMASSSADTLHERHLAYWIELANDLLVDGELTKEGRARLAQEEENLHAALQWGLENPSVAMLQAGARARARQGVRLALLLTTLWENSGRYKEPYWWLQRAVQVADELGDVELKTRVHLLHQAGAFARFNDELAIAVELLSKAIALGREDPTAFPHNANALLALARVYSERQANDASAQAATEALTLFRMHNHPLGESRAYAQLGSAALDSGDWKTAQEHIHQSLELARTTKHPRTLLISLRDQSELAYRQNDLDTAERYAQESLVLNAEFKSDWFQGAALNRLGVIAEKRGDWERARAYLTESLAIWDRSGKRSFVAQKLMALTNIEVAAGQLERAAVLWGAADALAQATGVAIIQVEQLEFGASLEILRAKLDAETHSRAYAQGHAMSYAQMVQFVLGESVM